MKIEGFAHLDLEKDVIELLQQKKDKEKKNES